MKKFGIGVLGAAKLSLGSSFFGYLLLLSLFAMGCENSDVAGLTVSYHGAKPMADYEEALFSECNSDCSCSKNDWDPICGENGVTYVSACLAGCQASNGSGKSTVFFNCSCVGTFESSQSSSAVVGPCQKGNECPKMFLYFLVISVITSYTLSVGGTPGYILLLRCIKPHLKSFALGIYTLAIRVLAGIPAPVYFGVAIDTTCLKWGSKRCGGRGACRLYDSSALRSDDGLFQVTHFFLRGSAVGFWIILEKSVLIVVGVAQTDHSAKKSVMTVETKPSNVNDSNQEAEPDQLLDDDENKDPPVKKTSSCTGLKVFLAALSFSYFSKALSGTIMKSSITQIERRFELTSSTAGFVDGSFEMGNLLVIAFVSYFGAKLHRPKVIAVGSFTMALGSFLSAMPHFFMGYYKYETTSHTAASANLTSSINPCSLNQDVNDTDLEVSQSGCEKEPASYMWIYILLGNLLRGIGETPITPLGISYLDDFAKEENVPVYVACLHTIAMMGPMFGFLLGSLCARLYVDIGFVDPGSITITPQDSRWVGAWWLGFLIAGAASFLSAIPFCFLPKSLKKPEGANKDKTSHGLLENTGVVRNKLSPDKTKPRKWTVMLKDFCNSLKKVLGNRMYFTFLCYSLLQFSGFIGFVTYKPKYMEQQYGQSTSKSNFLIGVTTLPPVGLGIFIGGLIMKKYKMGFIGAAKFSFTMSFVSYAIGLLHFFVGCDNHLVAGMTVSYEGNPIPYHNNSLFSECNSHCKCASNVWDPVCGANEITYVSACLAGCETSVGHGRNRVFHNCRCLEIKSSWTGNNSATLGQCPKSDACSKNFIYYTVIQVIGGFCYALGATPSYMLMFRCVQPELKALAVGLFTLTMRMLAGIPAPVYFGAAIDKTCLKWGSTGCGKRGACRLYDSNAIRYVFLGLGAILRGPSYLVGIIFYILIKKHFKNKNSRPLENGQEDAAGNKEDNCKIKERLPGSSDAENESSI